MKKLFITAIACTVCLLQVQAQRPQRGERPAGGGNAEGAPGAAPSAATTTKYHYKDMIRRISFVTEGKGN